MKSSVFFELVRMRFSYLFDDYGFSVIHEEHYPEYYGNAAVVLQSDSCRIRVLLDREQVLVEAGPLSAPEEWSSHAPDFWFGLTYITAFLTQGVDQWGYQYPDTSLDLSSRIDRQMVRLASKLRAYCDQIIKLFRPEAFEITQEDLLEFQEQQVRAWLSKATGKA